MISVELRWKSQVWFHNPTTPYLSHLINTDEDVSARKRLQQATTWEQHRVSPVKVTFTLLGRERVIINIWKTREPKVFVFSLILQFMNLINPPWEDVRTDKLVKGRTRRYSEFIRQKSERGSGLWGITIYPKFTAHSSYKFPRKKNHIKRQRETMEQKRDTNILVNTHLRLKDMYLAT